MLQVLSMLRMSYTVQRVTVISIFTKPSVGLGTPRRQCPEIMLERGVIHWTDFARWSLGWHPVIGSNLASRNFRLPPFDDGVTGIGVLLLDTPCFFFE